MFKNKTSLVSLNKVAFSLTRTLLAKWDKCEKHNAIPWPLPKTACGTRQWKASINRLLSEYQMPTILHSVQFSLLRCTINTYIHMEWVGHVALYSVWPNFTWWYLARKVVKHLFPNFWKWHYDFWQIYKCIKCSGKQYRMFIRIKEVTWKKCSSTICTICTNCMYSAKKRLYS